MRTLFVVFTLLFPLIGHSEEAQPDDAFVAYMIDGWDQPPEDNAVAVITHTSVRGPFLSESGHYMTECAIHFEWMIYTGGEAIPLDSDGDQEVFLRNTFLPRYAVENVLLGNPSGCAQLLPSN